MSYNYDRPKTAAVGKVPIFNKFDTNVSAGQIEKMVASHYKIVSGSLRFKHGVEQKHNGAYVNFEFDVEGGGRKGQGSVITFLENDGGSVRCVAFVNIDG